MEIVAGGYSGVIFADNANFNNSTEIKKLLKRGTSIDPGTIIEEFAENEMCGSLKSVTASITSADYDETVYDLLKSAEEARTSMYFRFFLLNPLYYFDLLAVRVYCNREINELGKFNAVNVMMTGSAVNESDLMSLVKMFNIFNPENV